MAPWQIVLLVVGIVLIVLLILLALFGFVLFKFVVFPHCWKLEDFISNPDYPEKKEYYERYKAIENKDEFEVTSFDGYVLKPVLIPSPNPSKKYVVISHGYTVSKYDSLKYAYEYLKKDYNVVIYTNRNHDDNPKTITTMGIKESKDLIEVINAVYNRYGQDIYLGLHGESMGSALQILSLKYKPNVKFIVNDCGYARLNAVLKHKLGYDFHLPGWLLVPANIMGKLIYHFNFSEINPIDCINEIDVPICFMHGENDNFINKCHSQWMYDAHKAYSEIHYFEDADHAESIEKHKEEYSNIMLAFLDKIEKENNI